MYIKIIIGFAVQLIDLHVCADVIGIARGSLCNSFKYAFLSGDYTSGNKVSAVKYVLVVHVFNISPFFCMKMICSL